MRALAVAVTAALENPQRQQQQTGKSIRMQHSTNGNGNDSNKQQHLLWHWKPGGAVSINGSKGEK